MLSGTSRLTPSEAFASPLATVNVLARDTLPVVLVICVALAVGQAIWLAREETPWARNALLGTGDFVFIPLVPLLLIVSTAMYVVAALLVHSVLSVSASVWLRVAPRADSQVAETLTTGPSRWLGLIGLTAFVW